MTVIFNQRHLSVLPRSIFSSRVSSNFPMVGAAKALCIRFCYLLAFILLYAWIGGHVIAQVRFVQITDPHLFDKSEDDMSENKQALVEAVWEINKLQSANGAYDFVVVTGDIGVEEIVRNVLGAEDRNIRIDNSAKMMANVLAFSEVKQWLFVPGNNDLEDEMPNTIESYHRFIDTLRVTLSPLGIVVTDSSTAMKPAGLKFHDNFSRSIYRSVRRKSLILLRSGQDSNKHVVSTSSLSL